MNDDFDDYPFFSDEERDLLEMAQVAFQQGDLVHALELGEAWLEDHPLDVEAMHLCALAAAGQGDESKAMALYRKALRFEPAHGTLHHNIGALLERRKDYVNALYHLRRALELQPDFPEIYMNLGNVLDALGQSEEALAMYQEALRRLPDTDDVYFNQGCTLNRMGRYLESLESFETILKDDPDNAAALNGRGLALVGLGRDAEAIDAFSAAIRYAPDSTLYLYNRALALRGQQRLQDALLDLDKALIIDAGFLEASLQKAEVLHELGQWDASWQALATAGISDPARPEIACCKGLLLESQGDLNGALMALEQCLTSFPNDRKALGHKGLVLMELGRYDEAILCFNAVLAQGENPEIAYRRACIYAQQGQVRKAVQSLGQAAAHDPAKLLAAQTDSAFDAVRESPSFRRLFKKYHLT
ncbi:MAG: tetratricopeptide repeat protein [Pedobacter sp.]